MFWNKKKEISPLLRGLVDLYIGKPYNGTWTIDLKRTQSYNDICTFEVYETKRFANKQSEIRLLSAMNGKKVSFDKNTSYVVPSSSISWLMYDTEKLFEEYEKLKTNKVGLNSDFHKSLEEFKSVVV